MCGHRGDRAIGMNHATKNSRNRDLAMYRCIEVVRFVWLVCLPRVTGSPGVFDPVPVIRVVVVAHCCSLEEF